MQVTALLHIVQLTAFAVSAAKLPTLPSTLYEAPLEDLPTHTQSTSVTQTSSQLDQVPAVLSTLYEAPAADIPSAAQSSLTVQNPSGEKLPSTNLPSPTHQSSFVQSPGIEIPVPAVPSTLYDLPVGNLPKPVQQSNFVQSTVAGGSAPLPAQPSTQFDIPAENLPEPAQPSTQYDIPGENLPEPAQPPTLILSPVNLVPVPAEPSTLYEVPSEGTEFSSQHSDVAQASVPSGPADTQQAPVAPSAGLSSNDQQLNLIQNAAQIVPTPAEPSTLYGTPDQSFPLPSQSSPQLQTPSAAPQEQFVPVDSTHTPVSAQGSPALQVPTAVEIPKAPETPSGLYEVPNEAQSTFNINPVNDFKGVPESSDTSSHGVVTPSEPSGLYETPNENLPSTETLSSVQSALQPEINRPAKGSGIQILFPEQTSFENKVPNLVPVPSVPSTLYETPEASSILSVQSVGKAIPSANEFQSEYDAASSSLNTFSASSNSLVSSNVKGGMMMGMPYNFQWGVDDDSGNAFTHYETSDGKSTSGQYRVNLPDGRIQVVNFYDNGDGFHADVTYE